MNSHVLLMSSVLLNVLLAAILWRLWQGRRQTRAMLHVLLRTTQKASGAVRRLRFEPWIDEHVQAAEDAVDRQFSIIFAQLSPHEQIMILDDPEPAAVPKEPGTDDM